MNEVSAEQLAAMTTIGLVGFAVAFAFVIVFYVLSAWLMNVSLGIVGNKKPGIIKCMGWLFLTGVANMTISALLNQMLGIFGGLIAIPFVIFTTIYILSIAGDCNLLQGFLAWMLHCLFSVGAAVILCIAVMVPLAAIGSQADGSGESWKAMLDSMAKQSPGFDSNDQPAEQPSPFGQDIRPVNLNQSPNERLPSKMPAAFGNGNGSTPPSSKPRRSADGSHLNPFFNE